MLGFAYMLACRTFFRYDGGRMGTGMAGLAFSGLFLMISIVNRGVSSGSGQGLRYGRHVGGLFANYVTMLLKQAVSLSSFGPLELGSVITLTISLGLVGTALKQRSHSMSKDPGAKTAEAG